LRDVVGDKEKAEEMGRKLKDMPGMVLSFGKVAEE